MDIAVRRRLPLLMLWADGVLLGRSEMLGMPRPGELVRIEDPFADVYHRYRVCGRERWFSRTEHGGLPPQEIMVSLVVAPATAPGMPPGSPVKVDLVYNGVVIDQTVSTVEPSTGDLCSVEHGGGRDRFRCMAVERWYGRPAPAFDGSTMVYQFLGTTVHLSRELGSDFSRPSRL